MEFEFPWSIKSSEMWSNDICVFKTKSVHFCSRTMSNGRGRYVNPRSPVSSGRGFPVGRRNRKCCMRDVKKRKSSIRARDSPKHTRRPVISSKLKFDTTTLKYTHIFSNVIFKSTSKSYWCMHCCGQGKSGKNLAGSGGCYGWRMELKQSHNRENPRDFHVSLSMMFWMLNPTAPGDEQYKITTNCTHNATH